MTNKFKRSVASSSLNFSNLNLRFTSKFLLRKAQIIKTLEVEKETNLRSTWTLSFTESTFDFFLKKYSKFYKEKGTKNKKTLPL